MDPFAPVRIERWPHPACLSDDGLLAQCVLGTDTSGGPGGQNRNKVETFVTIRHKPTGVSAQAGERRSQIENKRMALRRLRLALAVGVRTAVPAGALGSDLWKARVRDGRIACSPRHADFPCMLAEALDVIAAAGWEPRPAALRLGCTTSQLIKFVREHAPGMAMWNQHRDRAGHHPLK